jgi:hypothetical protein
MKLFGFPYAPYGLRTRIINRPSNSELEADPMIKDSARIVDEKVTAKDKIPIPKIAKHTKNRAI